MSTDTQLAAIFFSLAGFTLFVLAARLIVRVLVFHPFAQATHRFYVGAVGKPPECKTCPFREKCPYADGSVCYFGRADKHGGAVLTVLQ